MDEHGVPSTAAGRVRAGQRLVEEVDRWGVPLDKLYLDALVEPISVTPAAALISLETVRAVRAALPDIKTVICLTAISFGLPARRVGTKGGRPPHQADLHESADKIHAGLIDIRSHGARLQVFHQSLTRCTPEHTRYSVKYVTTGDRSSNPQDNFEEGRNCEQIGQLRSPAWRARQQRSIAEGILWRSAAA